MPGLEALFDRTRAQNLECLHCCREALQHHRAQIAVLEQAPEQPPGATRDHDGIWFSQRLKASREIRRLADDGLLLGCTIVAYVTDNHEAGSNPNAGVQPVFTWPTKHGRRRFL